MSFDLSDSSPKNKSLNKNDFNDMILAQRKEFLCKNNCFMILESLIVLMIISAVNYILKGGDSIVACVDNGFALAYVEGHENEADF